MNWNKPASSSTSIHLYFFARQWRTGIAWIGGLLVFFFLLQSCYSFKGVSIPAEVNTFFITDFKISNRALKAPRELGVRFADELKQQILRESRLTFSDANPDIEFSGEITRYAVVSVAPQPDETTAFSRLDISINVTYIDHQNEDNNWEKSFSDFRNFERSQNFLDVQDGLVNQIFEQIGEDIFNQTFSNW